MAALRRAVREVVRRHEVLRTTYEVAGGSVVQVVGEAVEVELEVEELRAVGERRAGGGVGAGAEGGGAARRSTSAPGRW